MSRRPRSRSRSTSGQRNVQPLCHVPEPKSFTRPRIILYRFLDVIKSKHQFVVEMVKFALAQLPALLEEHHNSEDLISLVEGMRNTSLEDSDKDADVPIILDGMDIAARQSIMAYINYKCVNEHVQFDVGGNDFDAKQLIKWVVLQGVLTGRFVISIDPEVVKTFRYFKDHKVIQVVLSTVTHKLTEPGFRLLSLTSQGDLTPYVDDFIEGYIGPSYVGAYKDLAEAIAVAPSDILLITSSQEEALAAAHAGLKVAKIREDPQPNLHNKAITLVDNLSQIRLD